jgi:drug/metabolite transporter (DMT)-like permease
MIAFAGNSLLARLALRDTDIDAASFTGIRLVAGAFVLCLLAGARRRSSARAFADKGSWLSAAALFVYAAGFSFAYIGLAAGTGALVLFGAVQATMIGWGLWCGERLRPLQWVGFVVAFAGLFGLLLPGVSAPPPGSSLLMLVAGIAWGIYSLRARGAGDPTLVTAGNFARAVPFALVLSGMMFAQMQLDGPGVGYAVASGAITSALGYAIWYMALPALNAATAASVQLSVPVIAAIAGVLFLSEPLTLRLLLAGLAILGGIALVIFEKQRLLTT